VDQVDPALGTNFSPAPGYNSYLTLEQWNAPEHQEALGKYLENPDAPPVVEPPAAPATEKTETPAP
jgi:hypothetical protein